MSAYALVTTNEKRMRLVKEKKTKRIKPHFELSEDQWNRLKEKMALRGSSASFFLREKVAEFLQKESSTESSLVRYRETYCVDCRYSDDCKNDKTLEIRCFLASLTLSPARLTEKGSFG